MADLESMRPEEVLDQLVDRLNTWHLELAILADAIGHVLQGIEEPEGLSAIAYVLRTRLEALVVSCPINEEAAP